MRYLGLALYSEGRTDDYFLRPLLLRLCDRLCRREARGPVDISDVEALIDEPDMGQAPRHERILAAARAHRGAWQILFIHGDGEGDAPAARQDRVQPGIDAVQAEFGQQGRAVGVIPVRETESWVLCDGDALRRVLGTTLTDAELGLPTTARAIETSLDPKRILEQAFAATQPTGQRLRRGIAPHLDALGEEVDLERLDRLPSFRALTDELRAVLRHMAVIA